jgi:hypothetical protein
VPVAYKRLFVPIGSGPADTTAETNEPGDTNPGWTQATSQRKPAIPRITAVWLSPKPPTAGSVPDKRYVKTGHAVLLRRGHESAV